MLERLNRIVGMLNRERPVVVAGESFAVPQTAAELRQVIQNLRWSPPMRALRSQIGSADMERIRAYEIEEDALLQSAKVDGRLTADTKAQFRKALSLLHN